MKPNVPILQRTRRGYTLAEILVSMTIMGLVGVGMIAFLTQGMKTYYKDRARLMINRDIRSFTSQMDTDAVDANSFCLYTSFTSHADPKLDSGRVGDYLVLLYYDPALTSSGQSMITKLVGYYREVTDTTLNTGPVHRFVIDLTATPIDAKTTPMNTVITNNVTGSASSYPIVTQLAQGLAVSTSGNATVTPALFYNFNNHSVLIDTQIAEALTEKGVTSQTGNTYNFTVSPRG